MIRITIELNEVVVGGQDYLSDMNQNTINNLLVDSVGEIREFSIHDNATFIKLPASRSGQVIRERIYNRFGQCQLQKIKPLNFAKTF